MQLTHLFDELLLGGSYVQQGLARFGFREKSHEIDRVPLPQRDADLRVVLESSDTRAMAGAWVDDDVRAARWVKGELFRWKDAQEGVIDRPFELSRVQNRFVLKSKHW